MAETVQPRRWGWRTIKRDTAIWVLGIAIGINEAMLQDEAQLEVLIFSAGLLGLPGIFAANDLAKRFVAAAAATQAAPPPVPPAGPTPAVEET